MIQIPRRSVTRFFIPLIDVLTLLFCIFLLMPLVKATGEGEEASGMGGTETAKAPEPPRTVEVRPDAEEVRRQRQELERLRTEKIDTLQQRLFVRVLEIDADTGKLYYQEPDQRLEIASQEDAVRLIAQHRREAGPRELYYLFLFPRKITGYPEQKQLRSYEGWFKSVAHGIDNPHGGR
jgi:hypothetical protein